MSDITIKIEGMSCGHCTAAVEGAVGSLEGVNSVTADLESGTAAVDYDDAVLGIDQIKEAIEDQGYDVVG